MAVKKAPSAAPQVDKAAALSLTDPMPASTLLLSHADELMHALTTKWGYPPFVQRMHMVTSHATRSVPVQLPPSVTYIRIGVLVSGRGTLAITDSATSDTTTLDWSSVAADDVAMANWVWTGGIPDDTTAANTAPPLKIAATALWRNNQNHMITLNPAPVGDGGTIWALATIPIWQDIAV